jgi:hypothetical protein
LRFVLQQRIQQRVCIVQRIFSIHVSRAADAKTRRDDTFRRVIFLMRDLPLSSWKKHFGARRFFRYVAAALRMNLNGVDSPIGVVRS